MNSPKDNSLSCKEYIHPGKLPVFWDRSVIFFANLKSLFFDNLQQLRQLEREIPGVSTYGGRLVTVINSLFRRKPNLLILEKSPNREILKYFKNILKLTLPDILIVEPEVYYAINDGTNDGKFKKKLEQTNDIISSHYARWIDGYVTDKILLEWAKKLGISPINSPNGCYRANNKLLLHNYIIAQGLPIIDTEVADSPSNVAECLDKLMKKGYRKAVAKSQVGASGIGMACMELSNNSPEIPEYMFFDGSCIVQGWLENGVNGIEKIYSPSVQLFVDEESISIYDITEQILSKYSVHEGNIAYPPFLEEYAGLQDELLKQALVAGEWIFKQSYRGTASVDFIVVIRHGEMEVRICEINARVTGATYPSILARYFIPHGAWIMRNLKTNVPIEGGNLLELMDKNGNLFYPGKSEGFIPINFNLDDLGKVIKGQFLYVAEDLSACNYGMKNFSNILPVEWEYDRD